MFVLAYDDLYYLEEAKDKLEEINDKLDLFNDLDNIKERITDLYAQEVQLEKYKSMFNVATYQKQIQHLYLIVNLILFCVLNYNNYEKDIICFSFNFCTSCFCRTKDRKLGKSLVIR